MKEIRERLQQRLQEKTGWGRNDLLALLDQITIDVLSERVEEGQITLTSLGAPDRVVNIRPLHPTEASFYTYTYETNFCRVFQLPPSFPSEFCFGGGHAVAFIMVDWFAPMGLRDVRCGKTYSVTHEELLATVVPFVKSKSYIKPEASYVILCDFGAALSFTAEVR